MVRSNTAAGSPSWLTTSTVVPAAWHCADISCRKARCFAVERRGGLIGQQQRRTADQGARCRHALLLANTERTRPPLHQLRIELQGLQQAGDLGIQRPADACCAGAKRRPSAMLSRTVRNGSS